jgi:hypothetical protein
MNYYKNEAEIEAVVRGFESCTTGKEDFKHRSHLTVAVWYLCQFTQEEGLQRVRSGLFRFLDHYGVGREKYNETLTIFWLKLVQRASDQADNDASLVDKANLVLERLCDPAIVFEYYSEASLKSEKAKTGWIEPDLKNL